MFMLDTDTVSFALRGAGAVGDNLASRKPSELCISSITLAELRFGADSRKSKKLHSIIDTFVLSVQAIPFDSDAASRYGRLAAELKMSGSPIGSLDALIAAHALSVKATLVTNNLKHFGRVRGLKSVTWL